MADDADNAADKIGRYLESVTKRAQEAASLIPAGVAGECDLCGEDSPRLVEGACAPCRDKWRLR